MDGPETGWYQDPGNPDAVRWWSGSSWTKYSLPAFAISLLEPAPADEPAEAEPLHVGPIRVAPAARVKRSVPRQPPAPRVESTAPIIVPAQGKVIDPNNLAEAPSSMTLLPSGPEPEPQPRRRRRRTK